MIKYNVYNACVGARLRGGRPQGKNLQRRLTVNEIVLTGNEITLQQIVNVARQGATVTLSPQAEQNILRSRKVVDKLVEEEKVVYGVTTGFGMFSETFIEREYTNALQKNLIVSHAVGAGDFFSPDIVAKTLSLCIQREDNFGTLSICVKVASFNIYSFSSPVENSITSSPL